MLLAFVPASQSQTSTGAAPTMQLLLDSRLGGDPGYKYPSIALGVSFEVPISTWIELQGGYLIHRLNPSPRFRAIP
jgi:hypothetical protein